MEIKLPNYHWFSNSIDAKHPVGNIYSGSVGTNPEDGCLSCATFAYTVYLKRVDDNEMFFFAQCWINQPWKQGLGCKRTNSQQIKLDASDESIPAMEAWLEERAAAFAEQN